ncbi:hypothetical protein [Paenibacillus sp. MSJ-34]|uniref:hypothetical protein n=1 Tax=Paenibacillus sp. MSJ-34 TaxID=2841529 RepID=UPI001C10464F|nr:hypothetical protein [Paenibacillus sp. MSJ-34]MBU5441203.1 hypothetical protein [Paenibacillus sp. MSJ-34]
MDPFKQLLSVFEMRMQQHAGEAIDGIPAELGTITETGLKLDSFKYEIQDYIVADWTVTLRLPPFSLTGRTVPADENGNPTGSPSGKMRFDFDETEVENVELDLSDGLQAGQRVLAIPVNGGKDAVVICIVGGGDSDA